jgi:GT2 family glycosyltransferase
VRDAASTLKETLESIRAQTCGDFRCLILDDGSTDASLEIAEATSRRDPRFICIRGARRGLVPTLNDGLSRTVAPFIARADADDILDPRRLELQLQFLERNPRVTVVSSRVRFFADDSAEQDGSHHGIGSKRYDNGSGPRGDDRRSLSANLIAYESWLNSTLSSEEIARDLFVESPLPHPSVMMRTADLRAAGGYRDGAFPEDYDLWLRGWRAGWRFGKLPEVLMHLRDHPGRVTRRDSRYLPRAFLACKVEHLVSAWNLAGRDIVVWGAGRDGVRAARELQRRGVAIRFFVDISPNKVGRRLVKTVVRAPDALREKPGCPIVAAVGVKGARAKIRRFLTDLGYRESEELVCFG